MPNAWNRFDHLDIFYHSMNYTSKGIINAAYCGAFKRKSPKEANQLIEDLAKYNYRAISETSGSSSKHNCVSGKYKCLSKESRDTSRASGLSYAESVQGCLPK